MLMPILRKRAGGPASILGLFLLSLDPTQAADFTFTVDVPTRLGSTPTDYLPNQTIHYSCGSGFCPAGYSLSFPGTGMGADVHIDGLALLANGDFLFSTDSPFTAPGGVTYQPADVIKYVSGSGTYVLRLSGSSLGLPTSADVDAIALDDVGKLILSFRAPETVSPNTFQPSDLVLVTGATLSLFRQGSSIGLPADANVTGFDRAGSDEYFMFDAPVSPSSGPTFLPGEIAQHAGSTWSTHFSDPSFPRESAGTDFSLPCGAPAYGGALRVDKSGGTTISWTAGGVSLFDLVRGDLAILRSSGGDFTQALNAIVPGSDVCLANDTSSLSVTDTRADPAPGGGYFYVLRPQAACGATGTYDSGAPAQVGTRDPEIANANDECP